jgi:large conductance mechanosensitive channel
VLELAEGLIMAPYFGAIIKWLIKDVIMPIVGLALGDVDFDALKLVLQENIPAVMNGDTVVNSELAEVVIMYGAFTNTILTFIRCSSNCFYAG